MTQAMIPEAGPASPGRQERATILACLRRIQRRLWMVRLAERIALALIWAGIVAIPLTLSRVVREGSHGWAAVIAGVALISAVVLWVKARRAAARSRGMIPENVLRAVAVVTAAVAVTGILLALVVSNTALPMLAVPVGVGLVFVITAAVSVRMIDARAAAIFVDQQAGLEERVATALEMLEQPAAVSDMEVMFRAPVIESAVAACHQVKRARVGYRRLDSRVYALAVVAAIAATGLTLIPPLKQPHAAGEGRKVFVQVSKQAKSMAQVLKEIEDKKLPNDAATAEKLKPLESALNQLKTGNMSPIDQEAALQQARDEMKRDQDAMKAADDVQKGLKEMQAMSDLTKAGDALKEANLKQAAGDVGASGQQQAAIKAMQEAAEGLANKMNGENGGMSDADKNKLASDLKDAAGRAGADPQLQQNLQQAGDAAQKGDGKAMAQNLQAAGEHMAQQQSDKTLSQDAVNRAMAQIDAAQNGGKSTAEQQSGDKGGGQGDNQGGAQANNGDKNQSSGQPSGDQGSDPQAQRAPPDGQKGDNGNQGDKGTGDQQAGAGGAPQPGEGGAPQSGAGQSGQPMQMSNSGSTNRENKGGPGGLHSGEPVNKASTFVQLYDQRNIDSRGATEKVAGHINPMGPGAGTINIKGQGDQVKPGIASYENALPAARQRAMDDLNKQEIPPQYQDLVKAMYGK